MELQIQPWRGRGGKCRTGCRSGWVGARGGTKQSFFNAHCVLALVYPGSRGVCMGKFSPLRTFCAYGPWSEFTFRTALCSILTHIPASTVPMFISFSLK